MSSIADVAAKVSPPVPQATKAGGDVVNQETFLKLLVSQMQNQDPLNPQDPTQFTAQLAQFSSLEQLVNVNTNLKNMTSSQSLNAMVAATSFIGKTARVNGNAFNLAAGTPATVHYNISVDSAQGGIGITNNKGVLVRTVNLGAQARGSRDFQWDGKLADGSAAPAGKYKFDITASDVNGDPIIAQPSVDGAITGVHFENGQPMLEMGTNSFVLGDLISIH